MSTLPSNPSGIRYPVPDGVMWDNYRITVTDADDHQEEYFYDGLARASWYRDKNLYQSGISNADVINEPKVDYNFNLSQSQGVISKIAYPDNTYIEFSSFAPDRNPRIIRDRGGKTHGLTYTSNGQVETYTNPDNNVTTYEYAADGIGLHKIKRKFGGIDKTLLTFDYYSNRDLWKITNAKNQVTTMTYIAPALLETITSNVTGDELKMVYPSGLPTSDRWPDEIRLNNIVTGTLDYDLVGRLEASTNTDGYTIVREFDGLNRLLKGTYPDGTYSQFDWAGRNLDKISYLSSADKIIRKTGLFHDALGQNTGVIDNSGAVTAFDYTPAGDLDTMIDANENATGWKFNEMGQPFEKRYADGSKEHFTHHPLGGLDDFTNRLGIITDYGYDNRGNLTTLITPGVDTVTLTPDEWDRLDTMIDGIGTTTYEYDELDRVEEIDGPWANDNISVVYDDANRKVTRTIAGVSEVRIIDQFGRLASIQNPLGFTEFHYVGNTQRLDYIEQPNNTIIDFDYHPVTEDFLLQAITNETASSATISEFTYAYNNTNHIETWTKNLGGTPTTLTFGYSASDRLESVLESQSGTQIGSRRYGYDKVGNRTSVQEGVSLSITGHNNLNQPTHEGSRGSVLVRGQLNEARTATVAGKTVNVAPDNSFETRVDLAPGSNQITVGAEDHSGNVATPKGYQIDSIDGASALSYDAAGNLLADDTRTYEWNPIGQLTAINLGTHRSEFVYDGFGRRVEIIERDSGTLTSHRRYLWCGMAICEERDAATNTVLRRFYTLGEQRIGGADAGLYYYTRDHLGSIRELVDSTGAVRARYDYGAYGERTKISGDLDCLWGFTGHHTHAASGLLLAPYRAYDPERAVWISADPIRESGGVNLYGYVLGDPINLRDPNGLWETGSYWGDVWEVWKGYGDAGVGTVTGLYQMGRHPIQTAKGIGEAASNPGATWQAIKGDYAHRLGSNRGSGSIIGDLFIGVATGGSLKAADKLENLASLRRLTAAEKNLYKRVTHRKGVRESVWERSKSADGKVYDPSGVEIKPGERWEMGHAPGHELAIRQRWAGDEGMTRNEWLDYQNDPDIYRPELSRTNSGHEFEDPWYDTQ